LPSERCGGVEMASHRLALQRRLLHIRLQPIDSFLGRRDADLDQN
jgi:hypothetical protein